MKKSDLKTGNKVKLKNGMEFLVLLNCSYQNEVSDMLIQYNQNGCLYLRDYSEDLHLIKDCYSSKDYNVISVYKNMAIYKVINENTDWELLWEREEVKPIKIAEALKAYNKENFIMSLLTERKFHMLGRHGNMLITDATQEEIDDNWIFLKTPFKYVRTTRISKSL